MLSIQQSIGALVTNNCVVLFVCLFCFLLCLVVSSNSLFPDLFWRGRGLSLCDQLLKEEENFHLRPLELLHLNSDGIGT